ncbi:hypothetical protein, partial [Staphylococcus pseudintermedius]|uniref:hypothetical protein n=1 Tax=Staphylococcus pseudintermedius TaxID=283734 RepID=UPI001C6F0FDF
TELMFVAASGMFLVYQSLWAKIPVGSDRGVVVIAHSQPPTSQTVDSTLPPAIMGVAFLDAEARGQAS